MSCCGNKRSSYTNQTRYSGIISPVDNQVHTGSVIFFQYVGNTGLTVYGEFSGKKYIFNNNGSILPVDFIDSATMLSIPTLKTVGEGKVA